MTLEAGKSPDQMADTVRMRAPVEIMAGILVLFALNLSSLYSYLLFHSLAELFSIIVACGIFMVTWNARRFMENNYLLFLGIAYLFTGGMDLVHTLAYRGMGVFPGYNTNLPTQLWIATRYLESVSFFIAPFLFGLRIRAGYVFAGYVVVVSLLLSSIFYWEVFPDCFVEGAGLTLFKKLSEYIICLILLSSMVLLLRKRSEFDKHVLYLLVSAILGTIGAELAFTLYVSAYGLSNKIGHFFKIVSFYLIYKAIIETGLVKPYSIMFRKLKKSEETICAERDRVQRYLNLAEEFNREIEPIVAERTMSLMALTMADKVRNPAAIIGMMCKRLKKAEISGKTMEFLEDITDEADKLEKIVKNFETLLTSRQSMFVFDDINRVVKESIALIEYEAAEKGISLAMDLSKEPLKINLQKNLLRIAIFHLLRNAVEATPAGGRITARTWGDTGKVLLAISDTGRGFAREDMDKVFDQFYTTKKRGYGMGLPLVKQIVSEHLGEIRLESEEGKGSTFMMTFPIRWI